MILATSFIAEGEVTACLLGEVLKSRGIGVSWLALGVPIGPALEYVELGTLPHALAERR